MIKKTIKYVDFNGDERVEDLYFNLSSAELAMMELEVPLGLSNYLNNIVEAEDVGKIAEMFCKIIEKSYGFKSEDGRRFIKNKEATESFMQSAAYSELFMSLISNDKSAADFINGIVSPTVKKAHNKKDVSVFD